MAEGAQDTFREFSGNIRKFKRYITPLRGLSAEVATDFEKRVDFLFIDGGHDYESVKADVDCWLAKLNPNGLVLFHDISWADGVQRVVREDIKTRAQQSGQLPNLYWAWLGHY